MDKLFAESSRNQKHRTGNFDLGHQQGSVVLGPTWSYEQRVTVAAFIIISGPRMRTVADPSHMQGGETWRDC